MSDAFIRTGETRSGFSLMYHDIFDLYHPYIGDKALLYYMYLVRHRNNDPKNENIGKAWNGRQTVVEKFQLSFTTLKILDEILEASGLVTLERKPSGRGQDKIYYVVHDPKDREEFRRREEAMIRKLRDVAARNENTIGNILGKVHSAELRNK